MDDLEINNTGLPMPEPEPEDTEEAERRARRKKYIYWTVVPLIVLGMIYITGVQQALFYHRTPEGTPQKEEQSLVETETITLPVRVFIFKNDGELGSERSVSDIEQMVENASNIWHQGNISLSIDNIEILSATDAEIASFFADPGNFARKLENYSPHVINVFLTRSLKGTDGANGIAFPGIGVMAVADYTTEYDFRVFAHEVGHLLGLGHVQDSNSRLMYSGANGSKLTESEVLEARETAANF